MVAATTAGFSKLLHFSTGHGTVSAVGVEGTGSYGEGAWTSNRWLGWCGLEGKRQFGCAHAVERDDFTGQEARAVTGQENCEFDDVPGLAQAARGMQPVQWVAGGGIRLETAG